jgi:CheY-like chemotaxis protein
LRVLVVEDDPTTAAALAAFLRWHGHEVEVAGDGQAALESARACSPDVALLDIGLPGIDGHAVARELRQLKGEKRPLLVATTGHATAEDFARSEAAGIDLHLVKPVDATQLERLLERFRGLLAP